MENKTYINVAICGAVSVGKSTLLNSIFVANYSKIKLKRCTMVPQVYLETPKLKDINIDINEIQRKNKEINKNVLNKSENNIEIKEEDIEEIIHVVPRIHDFAKSPKDTKFRFFDIPGLNDSKTKDIYYNYFNKRFSDFDIILFVVDIYSGLNTSDEIEILDNIIKNCKKNKDENNIENKLIVLANKCDDLLVDENGELILEDDLKEMFNQIDESVKNKVNDIYPELWCKILPISSEDSYIYRMYNKNPEYEFEAKYYNKFGMNEIGKTKWNRLSTNEKKEKVNQLLDDLDISVVLCQTGFSQFNKFFTEYIQGKEHSKILINRINLKVKSINDYDKVDIKESLLKFNDYYNMIRKYDDSEESLKYFTEKFNYYILNYETAHNIYISNLITNENVIIEDSLEIINKIEENININLDFVSGNLEDLKIRIDTVRASAYEQVIDSENIEIDTCIKYFKEINYNNFDVDNYQELAIALFDRDIFDKNPKEIIELISEVEDICEENNEKLEIDTKITIIYNHLLRLYNYKYDIIRTGFFNEIDDKDYRIIKQNNFRIYIYLCNSFWTNNILTLPRSYFKLGMLINKINLRSGLNDNNTDFEINETYENILSIEYYLLDLIKKSKEE